ncbi:hypothetical protein ACSR0Z_37785 [Streptomyces viridosporus]|nr:hypothetical protein [Streptomyces viridosporus]
MGSPGTGRRHAQAMQHDPDRTQALLEELERQAVRTTKRARAAQ